MRFQPDRPRLRTRPHPPRAARRPVNAPQTPPGERAAPGAVERVRIDPVTLEPRLKVIGHEAWIEPQTERPLPPTARGTGICGSGIIEAVAEMFLAGVIDSGGRFADDAAD